MTGVEMRAYREHRAPLPRLRHDQRIEARNLLMGGWRGEEAVCARSGRSLVSFVPPELGMEVWDKTVFDNEFS